MWRFRRAGMVNSVLAFMGVVGFGVMEGIGIGVLCSLIILLKAVTLPDDAVLGQTESRGISRPETPSGGKHHAGADRVPFHGPPVLRQLSSLPEPGRETDRNVP